VSGEVVERLWTILSRLDSATCREKIIQHFCAFIFNPEGLCIPPKVLEIGSSEDSDVSELIFNERIYPKVGFRQKFAQTNFLDGPSNPPNLGFIILVHKDVSAVLQLLETIYR